MSIPTSLIVVLLVVAWLVVLVPMIAKRRDKVPRAQSGGNGFRVLRRAQASLKRPLRSVRKRSDRAAMPDAEAQAAGGDAERTLVTVGGRPSGEPRDAAEEWTAAHTGHRPPSGGFDDDQLPESSEQSRYGQAPVESSDDAEFHDDDAERAQDGLWPDREPAGAVHREQAPTIPAEVDEQEWVEHAAAASAPTRHHADDEALRPTPRRRGRGGYDPEAAEATRAYRYRQRRRVTLALVAGTAVCSVLAFLLASWLWVAAAISVGLLVLYLTYLRRQVRIEAQIRQRRMERLQRARQIRPEYARGRAPARSGRPATAPGRSVVDLDDDDPGFDHLEPYDPPVTYRRAAGQ